MELGSADVKGRKFPVKRKGFDRGEVTLYLQEIAAAMARLEQATRAAQQRIEELEHDVRDLHLQSENGFHQAVASTTLAAQQPAASSGTTGEAPTADEARPILAAAAVQASRAREKAEAIVEDALLTSEQIEANQVRLLAAAKANRDFLLAEAHAEAEGIVGAAREAAATTRADAQRFAEELRELTAAETIELVSYAKAMAAAILETTGGEGVPVAVDENDVTVDLREHEPSPESESESDVEWGSGLAGQRPSRYEARSAHLPQIGDEDLLDSTESLRDQLSDG